MSNILIPPIKCQGIKSKLIPEIRHIVNNTKYERWIEPFMGSGVVGFNIRPDKAIFADSNPHLIRFYTDLQLGKITPSIVKSYLQKEGDNLEKTEGENYYTVRNRFNKEPNSLDFLFLNRACFNGMIRFNSKGGFNVPFCRKPNRFAQAYITKIVNQVKNIQKIIQYKNYSFICQSFDVTLKEATGNDLIYCDPPYIGRHVDYFDSWNENQEILLHNLLTKSGTKFILSTWHSNDFRKNTYIETLWTDLHILTKEHFYHVGASEENRNPILEALITNFNAELPVVVDKIEYQLQLQSFG
ncbi:MAG: Dam family site-specific DNA-(adenine-N6)-methyltransferase [Candidatus Methanoperedens sp.]|nr:Dam family site-specific DNA-(adenine-N6)-methyltransferase [Candidatus Methanoperedens sp.]